MSATSVVLGAPAVAASASSTAATAFTVAAMRTAACTCSAVTPSLRTAFSCDSMHMPQPLIADTARHHSSKSARLMPWLAIAFMRSLAGSFPYSSPPARCRKR